MSTFLHWRAVAIAAVLNLAIASSASAAFVTVGAGCQYGQLQDAINATHGDLDEIHVRADYHGKPVQFSRKHLSIFGGYASCTATAPIPFIGSNPDDLSWLDGGLDSGAEPVIAVDGESFLDLRNFILSGGHNEGHDGGGIRFNSSGSSGHLELRAVDINGNRADKGAGLFFHGGATVNDVVLYDYSFIRLNFAHDAGGGIRLEGNTYLSANSPQTTISGNIAFLESDEGTGGGIDLRDNTRADIGSPGFNGTEVIRENNAKAGGGLSLAGNASVRLYSTVAEVPGRVSYNYARLYGGGVFIRDSARMCVSGGYIDFNKANYGSAVLIGSGDAAAGFSTTVDCGSPPGAIACPIGNPCNRMVGNKISTDSTGSTVQVENDQALVFLGNIALRNNSGGVLLLMNSTAHGQTLANCELSGNMVSSVLLEIYGSANLTIDGCTIAGNEMPGALVDNNTPMTVSNSIVWQPGKETLRHVPTGVRFNNVITQDANDDDPSRFDAYFNVRQVDPLFVDPQSKYSLQPRSPAVDYSPDVPLYQYDLLLQQRGIDIAQIPGGPYDIGAYELQSVPVDLDSIFKNSFDP